MRFMELEAERGVTFLVFPELSLTGYERELAVELAIDPQDARLLPLRELARRSRMVTVVGVPIKSLTPGRALIGALVFDTAGQLSIYTKQHLHPGEERVFVAGEGGAGVDVEGEHLAIAVCADFTHPGHALLAAQAGAGVYAASVLITEGGYGPDTQMLAGYAAQHRMAVLMANHGGATGGWESAGCSTFWSETGERVGATQGPGDQLLIATRSGSSWSTQVVPVAVEG
jgi:predicted amidohydrolase